MTSLSDYFTLAPQRFQVVGTTTVTGSAATTMTVSGLDLSAYNYFVLTGAIKNATGSQTLISLYYNSDTTATNYHRNSAAFGGSGTFAQSNDAVALILAASGYLTFDGTVKNGIDGKPRSKLDAVEDQTTNQRIRIHGTQWTSATNVTGITLSASVSSSLDVGSTFTVYGVVA